ncbi:MAG: YggS family pyridoxal phosphate-dependent enzyme [Gammaproteobacteria bacterium]|nr:YggS family pyridoxal phosphate-dependent enzyme [Gammaproteobacteria bacterium]
MTTITERLKSAINTIALTQTKFNIDHHTVQLLAVSKTKPIGDIEQAIAQGQRAFGENYVQEGVDKIQFFNNPSLDWHFIGPLQSNKTKLVAENFDWIHTIDRLKIAKRLHDQRPSSMAALNICIQINISGEENKSGITPTQLPLLAKQISQLDHLCLRGIMTIGHKSNDSGLIENEFSQMSQLFENLKQEFATVDTLSMGMSSDLELAIKNGSTMVRIGSAIFGQRAPK